MSDGRAELEAELGEELSELSAEDQEDLLAFLSAPAPDLDDDADDGDEEPPVVEQRLSAVEQLEAFLAEGYALNQLELVTSSNGELLRVELARPH